LRSDVAAAPSERANELAAHYGLCGAELRAKDRDAWLAALYAPRDLRKHLHALNAFTLEIAEIAPKVSQPILGEMRLRWWADAIEASGEESGARAHPVADALLDTIAARGLERDEFTDFLDAHSLELYDDPFETTAALLDYCRRIGGRPLVWSARCLGAADSAAARAALDEAGVAMGLTRIVRALAFGRGRHSLPPELAARGVAAQELLSLAQGRFEAVRAAAKALDEPARIALLPAATLPLYLESLRARGPDLSRPATEPSAWRRQWRLWRAARGGL